MSEYIITTDSNSDVRPEFIEEHAIPVIPQYYAFEMCIRDSFLNRI